MAVRLGPATTLRGSYEFFHDERVADRGISSFPAGRSRPTRGRSSATPTRARRTRRCTRCRRASSTGSARVTLRNRLSYGDYDKFYQNVFPGAVNSAGTTVAISAYNNAATRQNVFNQTDLIVAAQTGRFRHTLLVGPSSADRTPTTSATPASSPASARTSRPFFAPLGAPTISVPLTFRQGHRRRQRQRRDRRRGYVQDQIALTSHLEAVVGLRFDSFDADVTNNRTATDFSSHDGLLSPRVGLVYKPTAPLSLYGSYTLTYLPRAGEQLASLSLTNQALIPRSSATTKSGRSGTSIQAGVHGRLYRLDRATSWSRTLPIRRARSSSTRSAPRGSSWSCRGT